MNDKKPKLDPNVSSDLKAAIEWCKKAREILKIRKDRSLLSPGKSKNTEDSKYLTAALKGFEEELEALRKKDAVTYEEIAKAFSQRSQELAQTAIETNNQELARFLALEIDEIRAETRIARKDLSDDKLSAAIDELNSLQEEGAAERQQIVDEALAAADKQLKEIEAFDEPEHSFSTDLANLVQSARDSLGLDVPAITLKVLAKVGPEYLRQREQHEKYQEFLRTLPETLVLRDEIAVLDEADASGRGEPLDVFLKEAHRLFDAAEYGPALVPLAGLQQAAQTLLKSLPTSERDRIKEIAKARKKFAEMVVSLRDKQHELALLRGADQEPVTGHLDRLDQVITQAGEIVAANRDAPSIVSATEGLKNDSDELIKKAKEAAATLAKQATDDLKSVPDWQKHLARAEQAYATIEHLPGADNERAELQGKILDARSKIHTDGLLSSGYAVALKTIGGYDEIRKRAEQTSAELQGSLLPPELTSSIIAIGQLLSSLSEIAPTTFVAPRREQYEELLGTLRLNLQDPAEPKQARDESREALERRLQELQIDKQTVEREHTTADRDHSAAVDALNGLVNRGIPAHLFALETRRVEQALATEMADREWARASAIFQQAIQSAQRVADQDTQFGAEWKQAAEVLANVRTLAPTLFTWRPLASEANSLLEDANSILKEHAATRDLAAGLVRFREDRVQSRFEALSQSAIAVPSTEDRTQIFDALATADGAVHEAVQELSAGALKSIEKKLKNLVDPRANELHKTLADLQQAWRNFATSVPTGADLTSQAQIKLIESRKDQILKGIAELSRQAAEVSGDATKLEAFRAAALQTETADLRGRPSEHLEKLFQALEVLGDDTSGDRAAFEKLDPQSDHYVEDVAAMEKILNDRLFAARGKVAVSSKETAKVQGKVKNELKTLAKKHKRFDAYHDQLTAELEDISSLLESDDPYLVSQAQDSLTAVEKKVAELDRKKRDDGDPGYSAVNKIIDRLSETLGAGEDRVVNDYLPVTYKRLYADLKAAIVAARASSPKDALAIMKALEAPIADAVRKALKRKDETGRLKERIKELKDRWKSLKASLKGDKVESLVKFIESRLDEAKSENDQEDGLETAESILDDLVDRFTKLEKSTDRRTALQEMDGECAQEQRRVRDLARQFEADVKVIDEQIIPQAKKALAAMDNGDTSLTTGLSKMTSSAKNLVRPYLNVLSANPLKSDDKAPRLEKVEADFREARNLLVEVRRAAERMIAPSTSTNVDMTSDLKKVHRDWVDQVTNAASAFRDTSVAIRKAAADIGKITGDEGLPADAQQQLEQAAETAARLVDKLALKFRADAFDKPIGILRGGKKDAAIKERKAAREEALRIMREYRAEVLKNPVLKKLSSDRNPFHADKVMAALAYLRASLKRIELASLEGI